MNKVTKTLLSLAMVSLSTLVVPIGGHNEDLKTEPIKVQVKVNYTGSASKYSKEEQIISEKSEIETTIEEMNKKMSEIENINDKKDRFIAYKNIVSEYSHIIDSPETVYDYFTDEELDLLFHVVQAEIGDEYSFEQKTNVASVIFNRYYHDRFPDTLEDILVADQFSTIANGQYRKVEVSTETILACEYAFCIENTVGECLFFDSNSKLKYEFVFNDGAHNFYKLNDK